MGKRWKRPYPSPPAPSSTQLWCVPSPYRAKKWVCYLRCVVLIFVLFVHFVNLQFVDTHCHSAFFLSVSCALQGYHKNMIHPLRWLLRANRHQWGKLLFHMHSPLQDCFRCRYVVVFWRPLVGSDLSGEKSAVLTLIRSSPADSPLNSTWDRCAQGMRWAFWRKIVVFF